jgi:CheY-like chemotaxis protein
MQLLLVDDDPSIATLLSRALQDLGQIEVAAGGAQALIMLGRKAYDCILLDLHMPGVDGFTLLKVLAKPGMNKDTPVFVVTADPSDEARIRALREQALFVVTKPVSVKALRALVAGALGQSASDPAKKPGKGR